ncbi:MAG: hypothetical protein ACKO38_17635 [Planctomycetota bacterium]
MADRVTAEVGGPGTASLANLFETVLARPPSVVELDTLERSFAAELKAFTSDPAAAAELLDEPLADVQSPRDAQPAANANRPGRMIADQAERAAFVCVAHVVLSLEETVTLP